MLSYCGGFCILSFSRTRPFFPRVATPENCFLSAKKPSGRLSALRALLSPASLHHASSNCQQLGTAPRLRLFIVFC